MSRSTAGASRGWRSTTRANGSAARTSPPGPSPPWCWPPTSVTAATTPRATSAELLGRALAALPTPARAGRIRVRADAGYFAGQLARACLFTGVEFAIGARRTAPLWRILDGVAAHAWTDAIDMRAAQ